MKDEWELFADGYLNQYLGGKRGGLESSIKGESHDDLINVDKEEYLDHIVSKHTIELVEISFEDKYIETEEAHGRTVYHLHFPVSGNLKLLQLQPPDFNDWTTTATLPDDETDFSVRLEIGAGNPGTDDVQSAINKYSEKISENYESVISRVKEFNTELHEFAEKQFDETKRRYLKDEDIVDELDVPVKSKTDRPETFAIEPPEKREEIKVEKPEVPNDTKKVVPTLAEGTYMEILDAVNDIGKGFERSPHLFIERAEEDLRDYILFYLEMNFEGSATGETFNNEGKTDVLLRHDGANVFISECAWWGGKVKFQDKISQLEQYLTWRDTKTAVILFTDNESISGVHDQIREGAREHPDFMEFKGIEDNSWFQYEFSFPEDDDRTFDLAVLVFHLRLSD